MRDLLTESGSIFVQIGDENVHRVRAVMDEVFGPDGVRRVLSRLSRPAARRPKSLAGVCNYVLFL